MPKIMALWNQPDRTITPAQAAEIVKNASEGILPDFQPINALPELYVLVAENKGSIEIINDYDNIVILELSDNNGVAAEYDLLFLALDNNLLLFNATEGKIMCACSRYGIAHYVLAHENARIIDDPAPTSIQQELTMLDDADNTFAILEGPEGYVQTAKEDNNYAIEWNRGGIEKHYKLESDKVDLGQTTAIFKAFLANDIKYMESLDWCRLEFSPEDFED